MEERRVKKIALALMVAVVVLTPMPATAWLDCVHYIFVSGGGGCYGYSICNVYSEVDGSYLGWKKTPIVDCG